MKVVLLCGGKGTRLGEVTAGIIPKPMVSIGGKPILWHIMRQYSRAGFTDFVVCVGHLGWAIKEYFLNYHAQMSDLTLSTADGTVEFHDSRAPDQWRVTVAETGTDTMTGGRLKRVNRYLEGDNFMLTYGDGVSDVNLHSLLSYHKSHGKLLTLTGVVPPGRFGELVLDGDRISKMDEKPQASDRYINGGFMVMRREFIDQFLGGDVDQIMLEREPFTAAALGGEMMIYKHDGFWQCMDTMRDWELLNDMWNSGAAPWASGN